MQHCRHCQHIKCATAGHQVTYQHCHAACTLLLLRKASTAINTSILSQLLLHCLPPLFLYCNHCNLCYLVCHYLEVVGHFSHELCARSDAVRVKHSPLINVLPPVSSLCLSCCCVLSAPEPPAALLVHLSSGSHAVDGHVQHPLGSHNVRHDAVDVVEDA
jgi:hypothetical protein